MAAIEAFFAVLGLKVQVVFAGAVGALISLRFFDGLATSERWFTFVSGWALASYLAGPLTAFFELTHSTMETGISMLVGLFGMSLVAAVIKTIRETDWAGIVKRKTGGGQ